MDCRTCEFAKWTLTKNGRRHPNGTGRCECPIKFPTLPSAWRWGEYAYREQDKPPMNGGYLEWKTSEKHRQCQRWMPKPEKVTRRA